MATVRNQAWADRLPDPARIKHVTENGFTITRLWDFDESVKTTPHDFRFLVQKNNREEREIHIEFHSTVIDELRLRRRSPLSPASHFWQVCAESFLTNYLSEQNKLPQDGRLVIDELPPDELVLALHWRDPN